jgi:GT2 family glycosyltransferase
MENLWVYSAVRNHPTISDYSHWPHDRERNVDFVIGACLLVRREVVQKVGAFDPVFFMYSEEIDWQRRIRNAGWQVVFTPAARVKHLGGASGAGEKSRIKRHFFDSLDIYELKHHGLAGLVLMRMAMLAGCSIRALLWGATYVVSPARRGVAAQKAALHLWLCRRQLTRWRVSAGAGSPVTCAE